MTRKGHTLSASPIATELIGWHNYARTGSVPGTAAWSIDEGVSMAGFVQIMEFDTSRIEELEAFSKKMAY